MERSPAPRRPSAQRLRPAGLVEALEARRLLAASTFSFSSATYSGPETAAAIDFMIDRTGDTSTAASVAVTYADGTAVAGVDYLSDPTTINFGPGEDSATLPVTLEHPGDTSTPSKSLTLSLANPTGNAALGDPSTATVTIDEPAAVTGTTTTVTATTNGPGGIAITGSVGQGTPVSVAARVARTGLGVGEPTGDVTFSVDGVAEAPVALSTQTGLPGAEAEFTTSTLPVGQHTITASYAGSPSATASLGSTTVTVAQPTTFSLPSPPVATVGQPLTLTATVQAAPGAGTPTGTVTFDVFSGHAIEGNMVQDTAAVALVPSATTPGLATATYTVSNLLAGPHDVAASYGGDATFATNTTFNTVGVGYLTTTVLGASANPATPGQPVILTAVVTGTDAQAPLLGYPNELGYVAPTVTFTIDGVAETPVPLVASAAGPLQATAQFTAAGLAAGPHQVTATFNAVVDSDNAASSATLQLPTGPTSPVVVVPTRTTLTTAPVVPAVGRPYVVIATVAGAAPLPTAPPTGSAEFFDDGTLVANLPLDSNGQATLFIPGLAAGPHGFTVVYGGDASNGGSIGAVAPSIASVQRATAGNTTALVLTIGGTSLDPTSARDVSDYQITGPQSRSVKVRSATYNAAAATVTLRLASALNLRSTYQLRVIGTGASGLRGTNGSSLAGDGGVGGTDYQAVISKATPVRSEVQVRAAATVPQARPVTHHPVATRSARTRATK